MAYGNHPDQELEEYVPSFSFETACKAETQKAILVTYEGKDTWVPKTQILDDSEVFAKGDEGLLVITEWIAKQKDWL